MDTHKSSQQRTAIRAGLTVDIILKQDQRTGKRIRGTVKEILTHSSYHPHGIKVRLEDGRIGRVAEIMGPGAAGREENDH
jgi:uncharacterized repeat protein (TIGR03833 family)